MKKLGLALNLVILTGCGTVANVYDRGFVDPLGGWARSVRKIEAVSHDDPREEYAHYGYGDGWTRTGFVITIVDFPLTMVSDFALLPITIPGHYIDKAMR